MPSDRPCFYPWTWNISKALIFKKIINFSTTSNSQKLVISLYCMIKANPPNNLDHTAILTSLSHYGTHPQTSSLSLILITKQISPFKPLTIIKKMINTIQESLSHKIKLYSTVILLNLTPHKPGFNKLLSKNTSSNQPLIKSKLKSK